MKSILTMAVLLGLTIFLTSATTFMHAPQDHSKKGKKHINLVRVDENGKESKLDTVIGADQVFVWHGDTIGNGKGLNWVTKDGEFDFDVQNKGMGNVFVMKSGNKTAPLLYEFKSDDDSTKEYRVHIMAGDDDENMNIMKWHSDNDNDVFFTTPPTPRRMMMFGDHSDDNVIDLSDPGIISYEKKELRNGKEKIVIVREKPSAETKELRKEVIIGDAAPFMEKHIKVISDDDGNVKVPGDDGVWNIDKMEVGEKVIEKDGKKITIKKIKEGDGTKVNVEVEEQKEEK